MRLKVAGNTEEAAKIADEKFIPTARRFVAAAYDLLNLQRGNTRTARAVKSPGSRPPAKGK